MSEFDSKDAQLQLVTFLLDNEEYAIHIRFVIEILKTSQICKVPNTPYYVPGVINLRGKIIPVVDLRKCFNLSEKEIDKLSRIVVVELNGNEIGLLVDQVKEVLYIDKTTIETLPEITTHPQARYISGITQYEDRLLLLLDIQHLLQTKEIEEVQSLQHA